MSRDVVPDRPVPGHAVCLDLRAEAYDPEDRYGPDAAVRRALAAPQPAGERRFLVVDDADRLVGHQLLHERLSSYGPARVVCLAVGAPEERTLRRTLTLRPPAAGVLWLLDGFHGPDTAALRPLVDVLATPEVFDAVLDALCRVADGVAVPSVRILEHDLSDEARARAWRQAVAALTGPDVPAAGSVGTVPGELAPLLDESVPGSLAGHDWLPAQGRIGARLRACADALDEAADGHARVRGPAGLLTRRAADTDLPGAVERLGTALRGVRDGVADVLAVAGGPRPSVEERGLLADRGVRLPELPREVTRTGTVPALRDHTRELIARRLPLRSVAARLTALAARTAPAGSAARLTTLDRICGPARLDRLSAQHPFLAGGSRPAAAAVTALLALLAGLWPVLGWVLGPAVGLLAAALAYRTLRHRPNRSPDGRLDGGGSAGVAPRLAGGLAGGLAGAVLGHLLAPPLWVGALTLPVAVGCVVLLALRDWTRAVDDWWDRVDAQDAGRALQEIRALVVTTAVHDWLFAEVRHHCSDGAGAVARLLRGLAATADTHPGPDEGGAGGVPAVRGRVPARLPRPSRTRRARSTNRRRSRAGTGTTGRTTPLPARCRRRTDGSATPRSRTPRSPALRLPATGSPTFRPTTVRSSATRPARTRSADPGRTHRIPGSPPAGPSRRGWSGGTGTGDRSWSTPWPRTWSRGSPRSSTAAGRASNATPATPAGCGSTAR
ncbi:hypothetical protein SLA_5827 [Streptomyces laurentii]|uniref:Uncharacterized protein n=1 Tax=Streptomyces laurentii TaxID=39478 RepID=A0A160P6C7_STRLU|nr:hypothetical protein SLA_5827 [Streptomyces laurentii]